MMGVINSWLERNWLRSAKHYFVIKYRQKIDDAEYHANRLADDMRNQYGEKAKKWPNPECIVDEDVSYWSD